MTKQIHGGDVYRNPGALDFSSNMNPLGTPQRVIQAAKDSLDQIVNYPDVFKLQLKRGIAVYEKIPVEWIHCGNGAAEVIFTFVHALKPKKALLLAPTFAEYEQALWAEDCEISYHFLKEETGFALDEEILDQITKEVDLLILCNPNNPTGCLISMDLLEQILKKCQETDSFLMIDECFQDFVEDREAFSMKDRLGRCRKLFLLKAFTKRYAMAGIRLGYGLCGDLSLVEKMDSVVQPWNVSIPAQSAGLEALKLTEYVDKARMIVKEQRKFLKEQLAALGLKVYDSQANYVFFKGPEGLAERMRMKKILIRDCSNYVGLAEGYYRVAVRLREENEKLISALKEVILR